jgi:hypothetical protein
MMRRQNTVYGQIKLLIIFFSLLSLPVTAENPPKQWTPDDPCPTSINAVVPNWGNKSRFGTYESVHEALKICPNIAELSMVNMHYSNANRLPFKLDDSERYLSVPQTLSFTDYLFDHNEWRHIRPDGPHWSGENGTWPMSPSTNPLVVWGVDMFYRARWYLDRLQAFVTHLTSWPYVDEWCDHGRSRKWYEQRHTPPERRSLDNIQRWLEAMDFSQVHTLTIAQYNKEPSGKGFYNDLPRALTGLKTLKIQGRWILWINEFEAWDDYRYEHKNDLFQTKKWSEHLLPPARDFITALHPGLESLTWTNSGPLRDDVLEPVLKHHGSSLKYLEWTNPETEYDTRWTMSVEQIRTLGKWVPRLANLTIDMDRVDGVWPWKHLKAVAESLPKLTNLTIYLNMYDVASRPGPDSVEDLSLARPSLTKEASVDMLNILNLFKAGDKLQNVQFRQGDWRDSLGEPKTWDKRLIMQGERMWTNCSLKLQRGMLKPACEEGHEGRIDFVYQID